VDKVKKTIANLNMRMTEQSRRQTISFEEYLNLVVESPEGALRNVFQVLQNLISYHIGPGIDEYPDDPESIRYMYYNTGELFEKGVDRPFYADRIFANRLINLVEGMRHGFQQNKIYIFKGPPGCGKSTFLNNLLKKFGAYANTEAGARYEITWRLNPALLGAGGKKKVSSTVEQAASLHVHDGGHSPDFTAEYALRADKEGMVEIPCPSHDHPLLIIPKDYRTKFYKDLLGDSEFYNHLVNDMEYRWLFRDKPCTFCSNLYRTLLNHVKNPQTVHKMLYARHYRFNRRLGEGITVFNPGDTPPKSNIIHNQAIQNSLDQMLSDPSEVRYFHSSYAKTNNGIYALMDVKSHNVERFIELHNIISEGVHKVENIEENVNTLLIAVMNPEDEKNIEAFKSFSDRIVYFTVPYVMDRKTEVTIYTTTFGKKREEHFLPRVLSNFARVIISTRLKCDSAAMNAWIDNPEKYSLFCDKDLLLLKMEIYAGSIPNWITEEDRKKLTAKLRRQIIAESEFEGDFGVSGRDSIAIFNEFFSMYRKQDRLITMIDLCDFFKKRTSILTMIPGGFLDSLLQMYNYNVLQEVKEALYYYNDTQISIDIQNYLFATNFEPPVRELCKYTGEMLNITDDFFVNMERRLLGNGTDWNNRNNFRADIQRQYASRTLPQEMMVEGKLITDTSIYSTLHERYIQNLKDKVLDPFLENENFRRAIKEYGTRDFTMYDKRIQDDVTFLLKNLKEKFGYTEKSALEICIYVIDNNLAKTFEK